MVSIAKAHSAFTSESIAARERVVSVYFFIVLYLSTKWSLDTWSDTQCRVVQWFNSRLLTLKPSARQIFTLLFILKHT